MSETGERDETSPAEVIASECLCFRARRVSRALTRMYDEALRPLGIQATQLTLLSAVRLGSRRDEGGASMGKLADVLSMDRTTVSRSARLLEEDGLVRIERSPRDGRVRIVQPTEAGARTLERALPLWKRAHGAVVEALGPEAASELRDRLDATARATAENDLPVDAEAPPEPPRREAAS